MAKKASSIVNPMKVEAEDGLPACSVNPPKGHALSIGCSKPLIDREYRASPANQFLRELVKNGIQNRLYKNGVAQPVSIFLTPDPVRVAKDGTYKFMYRDNARGISADDMPTLLNKLSSSGHLLGPNENFGMGMKTSSLPKSPKGITIISKVPEGTWKMIRIGEIKGDSYGIHEWLVVSHDETTGEESTHSYEIVDAPEDYVSLWNGTPGYKGSKSGTMILLEGRTADEDTWLSKDKGDVGEYGDIREYLKYLNSRFYELPDGVEVHVFDFAFKDKNHKLKDRSEWPKSFKGGTRQVRGLRHVLNLKVKNKPVCKAHGTLNFDGSLSARQHWYLADPRLLEGYHAEFETGGRVAILHDGECYSVRTPSGKGLNTMLSFGLQFKTVMRDTFILIEPDLKKGNKTLFEPNGQRSEILFSASPDPDDLDFPWDLFGRKFRQQLPEALEARIAVDKPKDDAAHLTSYYDKVNKYQELMKYTKYSTKTLAQKKKEGAEDLLRTVEEVINQEKYRPPGDAGGEPWAPTKKLVVSAGGTLKKKVTLDSFPPPKPEWVHQDDPRMSMVVDGQSVAAIYHPNPICPAESILWLNKDYFRVCQQVNLLLKRFEIDDNNPSHKNSADEVRSCVQSHYELHVSLKIMDAECNMRKVGFTDAQLKQMLSPEILSFGLGGFEWTTAISKELTPKLKSLKDVDNAFGPLAATQTEGMA